MKTNSFDFFLGVRWGCAGSRSIGVIYGIDYRKAWTVGVALWKAGAYLSRGADGRIYVWFPPFTWPSK